MEQRDSFKNRSRLRKREKVVMADLEESSEEGEILGVQSSVLVLHENPEGYFSDDRVSKWSWESKTMCWSLRHKL